jgi:hypothetical protein
MKTIEITYADGREDTITVRGIPVRSFEAAEKAVQAKDEFALVALACDRPRSWVLDLAPESLSPLAEAMQAENAAFFGYCGRRAMLGLSPVELLRLQRELQAGLPPNSPSPGTSPGSGSPPA